MEHQYRLLVDLEVVFRVSKDDKALDQVRSEAPSSNRSRPHDQGTVVSLVLVLELLEVALLLRVVAKDSQEETRFHQMELVAHVLDLAQLVDQAAFLHF